MKILHQLPTVSTPNVVKTQKHEKPKMGMSITGELRHWLILFAV